jgi:ankyrin repeat protein
MSGSRSWIRTHARTMSSKCKIDGPAALPEVLRPLRLGSIMIRLGPTMRNKTIPVKERLLGYASKGDASSLSHLLRETIVSPDLHDRYGVTPLMEACRSGHLDCVEVLVRAGANVNAADKEKTTVLMHACSGRSDSTIVEYLIAHGVHVNERDAYGCTAIMRAASKGDAGIIRVLLQGGAEVNTESDNHETALTFAIVWNRIKIVEALIEAGANLQWVDDKGWTPLLYAVYEKKWKIANLLQEHGAGIPFFSLPAGRRVASKNARPRSSPRSAEETSSRSK